MKNRVVETSKSPAQTARIAKNFLASISLLKHERAAVIALSGDLGAGKTAFTKAAAKILGVKRTISSPTFVLIKKYPMKSKRFAHLFHIDAYRLKNAKELQKLGWKEISNDKNNIVFIEWPENVHKAMPKKHHRVSIAHTKEGYRKFDIKFSK